MLKNIKEIIKKVLVWKPLIYTTQSKPLQSQQHCKHQHIKTKYQGISLVCCFFCILLFINIFIIYIYINYLVMKGPKKQKINLFFFLRFDILSFLYQKLFPSYRI